MSPRRSGPPGTAEKLHSELVRLRGACERCGAPSPHECAHIIRRRFVATRTDEKAAWCLCRACHALVDGNVAEFMALVERTIGRDAFNELYRRAQSNTRVWRASDWTAETKRLRGLINALKKENAA